MTGIEPVPSRYREFRLATERFRLAQKKAFETDGGANQVLPGNPTSLVRNTYPSRPETGGFAGLKRDLSVNLKLLAGFKTIACDELEPFPRGKAQDPS